MSENTIIELEMGLSEKDFDDVLTNATKPYVIQATSTGYNLENDQQQKIIIEKKVLPPRVIASFKLPRMMVVLTLEGHDESAIEAFMKRFNRYMHRGGG